MYHVKQEANQQSNQTMYEVRQHPLVKNYQQRQSLLYGTKLVKQQAFELKCVLLLVLVPAYKCNQTRCLVSSSAVACVHVGVFTCCREGVGACCC